MGDCKWSPHHPALLATASGDGSAHIVDLRAAGGSGSAKHVLSMSVGGEVLSLDWNKYRQMTLATGSTDRTIKIWDGRGNAASMAERAVVVGHNYAVRDVAWSPHEAGMLASASYDMSVRIWNVDEAVATGQVPMLNTPKKVYPMHKEFASGVAWSLFQPGMLASTSWDMETHVWHALS
ncbi:peroxisomal targeting signal 2 receptor [Malassezia vespertilionis]|uniref:peroxisomal targeting signal 2 receptor n=1 Tax=Malassezia vespertilionis TaxID=2020962 RepID=UPI0024B06DB6|nr:peroxisomal targeting signal 2 receptor [Malassezia vespertilionis]WFD06602.1 peroxisomal targeting signal 2 receptor [Malassezia vespertilionis]